MEKQQWQALGVNFPRLLIPNQQMDLAAWCTIACDQYTSDRGYWAAVERAVGEKPSTLSMILPEVYLEDDDVAARMAAVAGNMQIQLEAGVMEQLPPGMMLIERSFGESSKTRTGLLMALDLECYDYQIGSHTLIRATEGTIPARIPPRLRIREQAPLEFSHIMVLIDDVDNTVIGPLVRAKAQFIKAYDGDLAFNLGHLRGYYLFESQAQGVGEALLALYEKLEKPAQGQPMLFAMGDGNHSFATAKAHWENVKRTLPEDQRETHPARFALCEVVNLHDEGLTFEAIHRVAFSLGDKESFLQAANRVVGIDLCEQPKPGYARVELVDAAGTLPLYMKAADGDVAAGMVDRLIAAASEGKGGVSVDYIHGERELRALATQPGNLGFLLPVIAKGELFAQVSAHGPLPRKAFSMGEADEKRCYCEGRRIRLV